MKNKLFIFIILCVLSMDLIGCEAFVRKFTRKKKGEQPQVEMVVAPEEWTGPKMSKEEQYRQYFLYWKSWQDELISALQDKKAQKKQLTCLKEARDNLANARMLLNEAAQKNMDKYLADLDELYADIQKDTYTTNSASLLQRTERIKRGILKDFSFNKIKASLI